MKWISCEALTHSFFIISNAFFYSIVINSKSDVNSSSHYTRDISPGKIQFFASLMNHHNQDLCIINNRTPPVNFQKPFGMCLSIEWKKFMSEGFIRSRWDCDSWFFKLMIFLKTFFFYSHKFDFSCVIFFTKKKFLQHLQKCNISAVAMNFSQAHMNLQLKLKAEFNWIRVMTGRKLHGLSLTVHIIVFFT